MKPGDKKIKAIVFDVGGVLQLGEKQRSFKNQKHASGVHESVAKKLKINIDQYFDSIDTAYALSIEGKITKEHLLKILSKNLGVSEKRIERLYLKTYLKKFRFNKQLFKQALILKKLDYKIAILSDQWHLSKKAHIQKKIQKNFSPIVISCDVRVRKPSKEIYNLLIRKLRLNPSEILFIDNQKWNTDPAKKLGIKTILFKNNKQLFKNKLWRGLFEKSTSK